MRDNNFSSWSPITENLADYTAKWTVNKILFLSDSKRLGSRNLG